MTTFAETQKTYVDGQRAVEPCPQEIVSAGFIPPRLLPSGDVKKGDVLTAQWFNWLLKNGYRTSARGALDTAGSIWAKPFTMNGVKYRMEMRNVQATLSASGSSPVSFTKAFKSAPIVCVMLASDTPPDYVVTVVAGGVTTSSFTVAMRNKTAMATAGSASISYIAIGEALDADQALAPEIDSFCNVQRKFIDGQTNLVAPSADQWAFGFQPTYKDGGGTIQEGDTLPANVLNFLFADIFARGNLTSFQTITGAPGVNGNAMVMRFGSLQVVAYQVTVATGGTSIEFPKAFRSGTRPFVISTSTLGTPWVSTVKSVSLGDRTEPWHAAPTLNAWDNTNASNGAICNVIAIGIAPVDPAFPNPGYTNLSGVNNTFAAQTRSFPDGQTNRIPLPAVWYTSGMFPPVRQADGSITPGSGVVAQYLNQMFYEIYAQQTAITYGVQGDLNSYSILETSKYFIAIGLINTSGWSSGNLTLSYPRQIKAGTRPFIMAADSADYAAHCITATGTVGQTDTQFVLHTTNHSTMVAGTPAVQRIIIIGEKP